MANIENDLPITKSEQDILDRKFFAKEIAEQLLNISQEKLEESLVFGLYGKWGIGKTSFINLIKENIENEIKNNSSDKLSFNLNKLKQFTCNIINFLLYFLFIILIFSFNLTDYILGYDFADTLIESFFLNYDFLYNIFNVFCWALKIFVTIYIIVFQPLKPSSLFSFMRICYRKLFKPKFKNNRCTNMIDFTPWNLVNQESAINEFFKSINIFSDFKTEQLFKNYIKQLCSSFSKGIIKCDFDDKDTIFESKQKLINVLKQSKQKLIIFIDDIDRLSDEEIYLVFKIIKSFANLPNIIYFLSLDKDIVANALNKYHENSGEAFLEKIIQIPINIPKIKNNNLKKFIFNELEIFIEKNHIGDESWQEKYKRYWEVAYATSFHNFFSSIRDVKRFLNALNITYSSKIHNEINIIDLWIITAIRLFTPELYQFIIEYKTFLTKKPSYNLKPELKDEEKEMYKSIINSKIKSLKMPLKDNIWHIISSLFPNVSHLDNYIISLDVYGNETERRINNRICCDEHFEKYFTYDINDEIITNSQIEESMQLTSSYDVYCNKLFEFDKQSKLKQYFTTLKDYISEYKTKANLENLLRALFENGDCFDTYDNEFLGYDIYVIIEQLITRILENISDDSLTILKRNFSLNKSIVPAINFTEFIARAIEKGEEYKYATKDILNYLKKEILSSIKLWATNDLENTDDNTKPFKGRLIEHRISSSILDFWRCYGNKKEFKNYVVKMTSNNEALLKFLKQIRTVIKTVSTEGYYTKYRVYKKDLEKFFDDIEKLKNRLEIIKNTELYNSEKEIVDLVLDGIEHNEKPFHDKYLD